jgi:hypothetical protein
VNERLFDPDDRRAWQRSVLDPVRKARTTDPITSHRAARQHAVHRGNQRGEILLAHSTVGAMTDDECQQLLSHIRLNSLTTRRSELLAMGLLEDSGERRLTVAGSDAVVWKITESGRALVERMLPA